MKKLSFLLIAFILCSTAKSQTKTQTTAQPIVDVKDQPSTKRLLEQYGQGSMAVASSAQVILSEYYGIDDQIKSLMINDQIPADFPKGSTTISKQEYITIANSWISKNKNSVKPQFQNEKLNDK